MNSRMHGLDAWPEKITFGMFFDEPTLSVGPKGGVREWVSFREAKHAKVLIKAVRADGIHISNAQVRAMLQIIRVAQSANPLVAITFIDGAHPWCWDHLKDDNPYYTFRESMRLRSTDYRKVLQRKKKLHPRNAEKVHVLRAAAVQARETSAVVQPQVDGGGDGAAPEGAAGARIFSLPVFRRGRD